MIIISNLEEMKKYYNEETSTYVFNDDIEFTFDVDVYANIKAMDIKAMDIKALDINAKCIDVWNVSAHDVKVWNISANYIKANNVYANDTVVGLTSEPAKPLEEKIQNIFV